MNDGKPDTATAVRIVYGRDVDMQLCVRHFIEGLKVYLREETREKRAETEGLAINIWSNLGLRRENDCFDALKIVISKAETR